MSFASLPNPAKIALATTAAIATAVLGYSVYFDHRRRHDPVFRNKLIKEHKKLNRSGRQQAETGRAEMLSLLKRALLQLKSEPMPQTVDEKERYFMDQVGMGEALAARGSIEYFVAAAIAFYKALLVYPAPAELLGIYEKTQPPAVYSLVMELVHLDVVSKDPREIPSDAILQEIEQPVVVPTPAPAAPASESGSASSPPSTGSYVHVEEEAVVVAEVEVVEVEVEVVAVAAAVEEEVVAEDPPTPVLTE